MDIIIIPPCNATCQWGVCTDLASQTCPCRPIHPAALHSAPIRILLRNLARSRPQTADRPGLLDNVTRLASQMHPLKLVSFLLLRTFRQTFGPNLAHAQPAHHRSFPVVPRLQRTSRDSAIGSRSICQDRLCDELRCDIEIENGAVRLGGRRDSLVARAQQIANIDDAR